MTRANQREGDWKGAGLSRETGGGEQVSLRLSGAVFHGAGVNDYLVSDVILLSLSMNKRVFHDLLKVRPSSLLML